MRPNRREMMAIGLGGVGALVTRSVAPGSSDPNTARRLAERMRTTPHAEIFDLAAEAIGSGVSRETFLAAVFLAGVHDVRPRHVGGKLHCVMMVESSFQLAELAPEPDAWLVPLWNLDNFKVSQARDEREGGWELGPPPDVKPIGEAKARTEFLGAMQAWDDERADRAITALLPHVDREEMFEMLWPFAMRCFADIGHKIIFTAHVERVLARTSWHHAQPALRSLVHGLLRGGSAREEGVYLHSLRLAQSTKWTPGKEDPDESATLLRSLRGSSSRAAQNLVARALEDGIGERTVWDGLRLYASEQVHRYPALLCVHAVTEVNAFGYVYRKSRDEATRRALLFQTAGWLPLLRDNFDERYDLPREEKAHLDTLGDDTSPADRSLDDVISEPKPEIVRSWLDRAPDSFSPYLARVRSLLEHKGDQSHHHKYAAALIEDCSLAHPRWRSRIIAPALGYLPTPDDLDTEEYEKSIAALKKAGVR